VLEKPVTIYGDGKQVRDMLNVRDLIAAYDAAIAHKDQIAGTAYNIGGGAQETLSIWRECGPLLEKYLGRQIFTASGPTRPGDQKVYISDIRKAQGELGWSPQVGVQQGVEELVNWVQANHDLFD
jgi:CDP-paratose 2-epimerase